MGLHNKARGGQRGIKAAAQRANISTQKANAVFKATGDVNSPAQRQANADGNGAAALRATRRHRGKSA